MEPEEAVAESIDAAPAVQPVSSSTPDAAAAPVQVPEPADVDEDFEDISAEVCRMPIPPV